MKHIPALFRQAKKAVMRLDTLAPLSGADEHAAEQLATDLTTLEEELEEIQERIVAAHDAAKALHRRIKNDRTPAATLKEWKSVKA